MQIKDPRTLPEGFYLVSKNSSTDLISFLITFRTQGEWNHSMISRTPGKFVSQGLQITESDMGTYMKNGSRLDFFTLKDINPQALKVMNDYINSRMKGPWWTQAYDFLGIVGAAIGQQWIHTPGLEYCSEFVLLVLRQAALANALSDKACTAILTMGQEANPEDLHLFYTSYPEIFTYVGQYDSDMGVIV